MARVKIRGVVEATWPGDQLKASFSTAEGLAQAAVKVLVEEFGADAARELLRDELGLYRADYKGAGLDERGAKKD